MDDVKGTRIASISGLRGWVGDGIDPVTAVEFAAAYASQCGPGAIVVSHDGRVSSSVFEAAVTAGVTGMGRDVLSVGATATPTVGVLVREHGAAGGVQISASHNPPEYNGLKFFQPGGMVLSPAAGRSVLKRWQDKEFGWAAYDGLGKIRRLEDPDETHLRRVLAVVDVEAIRARRFVVALDACHGAGGRMGRELLWRLGCRPIVLGGEPDGRYDHPPEPTETNLAAFAKIVPAVGAAVGFAQDPDADRLAIVDEQGRYIGEELTLALAAVRRLGQERGPVVLNLSTSRATEDLAIRHGCPVIRTAVGEINVVEAMLTKKAVLGGEGNGGVIDPRVGLVRDSFVGMALVLDLLATADRPLSSWVDELPRYAMVKDQYPLKAGGGGPAEAAALWDRIAEAHNEADADRRDGLRLAWDDRWVHVRASNTEPIVRVIAEAKTHDEARRLSGQVGRWVSGTEDIRP
ncbi:MAG: phosphoglucosamine mutase [Paludisphaera borealis]|uniref:phosphoglucosamine mutase n=1 Tax=Paludisphaera borealis TaxID=1387353 RepID=UPI00284D10E8|nr:phosphoglucosamine mutase [Paludisphaera borealis]MDR3622234.1 phosphoglucosamine mutase [Paludisphaera borealis]